MQFRYWYEQARTMTHKWRKRTTLSLLVKQRTLGGATLFEQPWPVAGYRIKSAGSSYVIEPVGKN